MNIIQKTIHTFDKKQQQHAWLGFPYAVVKKYGEDQAGYQSALLTYYGFLSLFPILLVLTTIVSLTTGHAQGLQTTIINSITNYFPKLGSQLSTHVHSLHKSGIALIVGIVFTIYGARGVADVFRHGVNHVWQIPVKKRDGFPRSSIKSLTIIIVGGIGFMAASLCAGYAGAVGRGFAFRGLSLLVNVFILFWLFNFLINVSLPHHISAKETRAGAACAAIGLVVLQSLGSYLLARELKNLDALYSTFAIALGLLFWLYLQAQVLYYSVEVAAVRSKNLWPRSLDGSRPTAADAKVLAHQHESEADLI
jgi:YihY family inner membrane protein